MPITNSVKPIKTALILERVKTQVIGGVKNAYIFELHSRIVIMSDNKGADGIGILSHTGNYVHNSVPFKNDGNPKPYIFELHSVNGNTIQR